MKTIYIKKPNSIDVDKAINKILYDLSKYGRTVSNKGSASRYLSRVFEEERNNGDIYFSWNKQFKKSIISLSPDKKLVLLNTRKCILTKNE